MTRKIVLMLALAAGVPAVGCMHACAATPATEKTEADEVKVKLEDCPKAVQDTLKKETAGAAIKDVDKESEDGKTLYEADATIDGKNYEIKVAEDGSLVSKKLDDDKEEEGEHEDKDKK